jgi:hypothetical protein
MRALEDARQTAFARPALPGIARLAGFLSMQNFSGI